MINKQTSAQLLLDAFELVDESMLQYALDIDTPEKFRLLGKAKKSTGKAEKPLTALQRWGALAACLAIAMVLAASPWFFSSLLPIFGRPTEPPQTTQPLPPTTGFTEEYDPTEPPALLAFNSQTSVFPIITGYDWLCTHDEDNIVEISSPWINPLSQELDGKIPWVTTDESTLQLEFHWNRDSMRVRCWPADKFGDPDAYEDYKSVTSTNRVITLKPGRYIYEVTGEWYNSYWGSGTVTYVFGAECSYVVTEPNMDIQILCGDMALNNLAGGLDTGTRYDDVAGNWLSVSGNGGWWTMHESLLNGTKLPTMTLTEPLTIQLGPNGTLNEILV